MPTTTAERSPRLERSFDRMTAEFGGPVATDTVATDTFSASRVYDKLSLLVVLAALTGGFGYAVASTGLLLFGIVTGFVLAMIGIFRPATARIVAPLYALAEGLALGSLTALYATTTNGIAPMAIIFTGSVYLAALVIFRSGLVKVTPKFVSMTVMAGFGLLVVMLASLFGLFPGLSSQTGLLVVGVIGLAIGVAYLFVDFNYVQLGEQRRFPAAGEWYAALSLMMSLVFVYISILRILASRGRR